MEIIAMKNEKDDNNNFNENLEISLQKKKMKIGSEKEDNKNFISKEENPQEKMKFLFPSLTSEVRINIFNVIRKLMKY
jgi:hypothetical protein